MSSELPIYASDPSPAASQPRRERALAAGLWALGLIALLRLGAAAGGDAGTESAAWERVRLDPNTAAAHELALLPGLGPARVAAVMAERERGGPFRKLSDLARVRGLGAKTIDSLAPYLHFEP